MGRGKAAIGTLVEASTRYVMLFACEKPTAENVRVEMTQKIMQLPGQFRKSITWDLRQRDGATSSIHYRGWNPRLLL